MTDENYNGWSNRETWAVALHVDNDEGLYHERKERMQQAWDDWTPNPYLKDAGHLEASKRRDCEEALKVWIKELLDPSWWQEETGSGMPDGMVGMLNDVGSLWRVNWQELAEHWIEDVERAEEPTA